jgi:hypothetical protein
LTGRQSDRLVDLFSRKPSIEKKKLSGIPVIQPSTGSQQCSAVINTLNSWKCLTLLIGMVFGQRRPIWENMLAVLSALSWLF